MLEGGEAPWAIRSGFAIEFISASPTQTDTLRARSSFFWRSSICAVVSAGFVCARTIQGTFDVCVCVWCRVGRSALSGKCLSDKWPRENSSLCKQDEWGVERDGLTPRYLQIKTAGLTNHRSSRQKKSIGQFRPENFEISPSEREETVSAFFMYSRDDRSCSTSTMFCFSIRLKENPKKVLS